jgi:two-component system CheB/CheR fusion protein
LRDEGHEVRAAYDGAQALAVAREFQPEAVLLDIAMPGGLSGWEVARQIRKASGDAHRPFIIAISAKYKQSPEKMAICNHFLTKPYDPNFLLSLLLPLSSSTASR